jgi:hypothetical protein
MTSGTRDFSSEAPFSRWEKGWGRGACWSGSILKPSPKPSPKGRGSQDNPIDIDQKEG